MKHYISVLGLLMLPACMGGGSDDTTDRTPSTPSVSMNTEFGTLMNGVRTASTDLTYDTRLGQAAQNHANDMVTDNYFSITIPGSDNGMGDEQDIGDRVTAQGYTWYDIGQLIEQGDYTLEEVLSEWDDVDCTVVNLDCFDDPIFVDFGLAKAGSGDDQKWVLVLANPNPPAP